MTSAVEKSSLDSVIFALVTLPDPTLPVLGAVTVTSPLDLITTTLVATPLACAAIVNPASLRIVATSQVSVDSEDWIQPPEGAVPPNWSVTPNDAGILVFVLSTFCRPVADDECKNGLEMIPVGFRFGAGRDHAVKLDDFRFHNYIPHGLGNVFY